MKKSTNTQALHQCEVVCDWGHVRGMFTGRQGWILCLRSGCSATNTKYCPLMRVTFRNGIVAPSRRPHVTCTRACCEIRSFVCELSTAALARTVCVSGSTCGDTNVIVVFASSSPVSFNNFTGNPTFRERE